jgi:hypothetical protein
LSIIGVANSDVLQRAMVDSGPYVRRRALGKLRSNLPNDAFRSLLSQARQDPNMPVRRDALQLSAEEYPNDAEAEFRSALLDPNIAMREAARYFFRKDANLDFRRFYLERFRDSTGRQLLAAVSGLGETGVIAAQVPFRMAPANHQNPSHLPVINLPIVSVCYNRL